MHRKRKSSKFGRCQAKACRFSIFCNLFFVFKYFCMFVDELLTSSEKKETQLKWMYELYTTFLMWNAPIKLKLTATNETNCKRLEDMFDRSPLDNIAQMKKIFDEIKQEAVEVVNFQLARFREVKQLGN